MKKCVKLISILMFATIICLSFCSCKQLDKKREKHAVWVDDQSTEMLFRGDKYKLLPQCGDIYFGDEYNYGFVTSEDVPVLLSAQYGIYMEISTDATMLSISDWKNEDEHKMVYCREDCYDDMVKAIENYKLDRYCTYDDNDYYRTLRVLSEQSYNIIQAAFAGEGKESMAEPYSGKDVYLCDEELRFMSERSEAWLVQSSEGYSVVVTKPVTEGHSISYIYYEIPQKDGALLWADLLGLNK